MKHYYLYIILWVCGIIVASLITVIGIVDRHEADAFLFYDKTLNVKDADASSQLLSKLLLSAEEFNISGITLINQQSIYKNKSGYEKSELLYKNILDKKIADANKPKSSTEFSIGPVPK